MRALTRSLIAILASSNACFLSGHAAGLDDPIPVTISRPTPKAPPTAPPIETRQPVELRPLPRQHGPGDTLYSVGSPTDEEQLYLEFLNRARANPPAEGTLLRNTTDPDVLSAYAFYSVDVALMESQFAAISPAPPLAMNAQLTAAARLHSGDMYTNQFQQHTGSNGSTPGSRATAQGYDWFTIGENIFAYSESVFYGHAGFEVDWGNGPGGMQDPPGHRENIHNATFREVGVGVVDGSNGPVGPQLVTQDFGARQSTTPLVTGVVYYDFNGNNFYDLGEGIGGVTVDVEPSTYYAVTAGSGGYAVPVSGNGSYTVTFTANGSTISQQTVTVSSLKNVKVDLVPAYSPPIVTGPDPAAVDQNNAYSFTPVTGASGYDWEQAGIAAFALVEGAENGLTDFTTTTTPGYSVVANNPNGAGNVFHLAHPPPATDQILLLNRVLLPSANSQLQFKSRLGWATTTQIARAQVSADGGANWTDVFTQAGNDGAGESTFNTQTVSLSSFAGKPILVRFVYDFTGGSSFPQTDTTPSLVGWAIDDIAFSNTDELTGAVEASIASGNTFVFKPSVAGSYVLRVRATVGGRTLYWGPAKLVTATVVLIPPGVTVTSVAISAGQLLIAFDVTNYNPDVQFQLLKSADIPGTWSADASATLQTLVPNSRFQFTAPVGSASRQFYRVQAN